MQPLEQLIGLLLLFLLVRRLLPAFRRWRAARAWSRAPQRDVSALAGSGEAAFKREVVSTTGPLKPKHRRIVLRDKRLLPKPPPTTPRRCRCRSANCGTSVSTATAKG